MDSFFFGAKIVQQYLSTDFRFSSMQTMYQLNDLFIIIIINEDKCKVHILVI